MVSLVGADQLRLPSGEQIETQARAKQPSRCVVLRLRSGFNTVDYVETVRSDAHLANPVRFTIQAAA